MWLTRAGASARAYSSAQMICWSSVAPRPPRLDRPAEADEPGLAELVLPRDAHVEADVLVAGTAATLQLRVLADDVVGEPGGDVTPEAVVVVGELDVGHASGGRRSGGRGHELDPHAVGIGEEEQVDAGAGARLLDDGRAAVDEVLRGGRRGRRRRRRDG